MSTKQKPFPVSLVECFVSLPDPRVDRTRAHKLIDVLVIGLCSTLAGGAGFNGKEDQNRSREGFAAQNLATLRRLALNVLKRDKSKCSMRLKVKKAGWNNDFLFDLLGISPE